MKKTVEKFFIILLSFMLSLSAVYAAPAGSGTFTDVNDDHWAARYITDMYNKGIIMGTVQGDKRYFRPEDNISKVESVILIARSMGSTGNNAEVDAAYNKYKPMLDQARIPDWAEKEVAYAMDKGVVTQNDLNTFIDKGGSQTKLLRYEAAVYIVRAMGLESEAKGLNDPALGYTDSKSVPDWARAYVKVAAKQGVFDKDGDYSGRFNPGNQLKRSEIAKILSISYERLNKSPGSPSTEISGTVFSVFYGSDPIITIVDKNGIRASYHLAGAAVKKDGKAATINDLEHDDNIKAIISGDKVLSIEATPGEKNYTGTLTEIKTDGALLKLTMDTDDGEVRLTLSDDADIKRNRKTAEWTDLKRGDELKAIEKDGTLVSVIATSMDRSISGSITKICISSMPSITVTGEDGDETYGISKDARIKVDGRTAVDGIYNLHLGFLIDADVESDEIVKINASTEKENYMISGTIKRVDNNAKLVSITVYDESSKKTSDKVVLVTSDTKIYDDDGDIIRLRDLDEGDAVTARVQNEGGILSAVFISLE